jgi:hypothetical protein
MCVHLSTNFRLFRVRGDDRRLGDVKLRDVWTAITSVNWSNRPWTSLTNGRSERQLVAPTASLDCSATSTSRIGCNSNSEHRLAAHDRVAAVRALYPGLAYDEAGARHNVELERFLSSRTPRRLDHLGDDDKTIHFGSVDELAVLYDQAQHWLDAAEADGLTDVVLEGAAVLADRREIMDRIRAVVFDYLVRTETQLEASDTVSQTLARHRLRVDALLETVAPDLRDQLQAALRAAREGGGEARSQVLTTCRRVLVAVADHLFPASDEPFVGEDGVPRLVGPGNYRNRVLAACSGPGTEDRAFNSAIADLSTRLDRLDELAQKGVHRDVSQDEMEFGLAQTYLLVGELMRRRVAP